MATNIPYQLEGFRAQQSVLQRDIIPSERWYEIQTHI